MKPYSAAALFLFVLLLLTGILFPYIATADGSGIPTYLFPDVRFWIFMVATWATIGAAGLGLYLLLSLITKPAHHLAPKLSRLAVFTFLGAFIYQAGHHIEHVAQAYQYRILGMPSSESHGILWFFNLEWNHFIFNLGYYIVLVAIAMSLIGLIQKEKMKFRFIHLLMIGMLLVPQGWHVFEHSVRITRHVQLGCEPCPGVLDEMFGLNLLLLHFWFNTIVTVLPLVVFLWYGFDIRITQYVRPLFKRRAETIESMRSLPQYVPDSVYARKQE
jgi:hypothetical protein